MQPRIHVITLAVSDLDRSLAFYRDGLGLESPGVIGTEFPGDDTNPAGAVAMFQLDGGLILALYPRSELAKDAGVGKGPAKTVNSASATRCEHKRTSTVSSRRRRPPAPPGPRPRIIDRGGSTQDIFGILTATCGKSCGTRSST